MKRKFTSGINALTFLVLMSTASCESIYIPDPIDPRLPKYTESGNNVAGALINDKLWKSEYDFGIFGTTNQPFVAYNESTDSVTIEFVGSLDEQPAGYSNISFGLKYVRVSSIATLKNLEGEKFPLGNGVNAVMMDTGTGCNQQGIGQIYFRSVKYNSVSDVATISGTFGFNIANSVCGDLNVTYGRFDMQILSIQKL